MSDENVFVRNLISLYYLATGRQRNPNTCIPEEQVDTKDWGDDPLPPPEVNNNTTVNNVQFNNFEINQSATQNVVYQQSRNFYTDNSRSFDFNVTINQNSVPSHPGSRLPIREADSFIDDTGVAVVVGAPITLQQSIQQQNFGQLMWNPLSSEPMTIRQVRDDRINEQIEQLAQEGLERYQKFLDNYPEEDDIPSIHDGCLLIGTESIRGLSGEQDLIYGSGLIRILGFYQTARSLNHFVGVSDTIPSGYEIVSVAPEYIFETNLENDLELKRDSQAILDLIGEIPEDPLRWQGWIQQGITATIDRTGNTNIETQANSLIEVIQYAFAQIYHRLGLEDYPYTVPSRLTNEPFAENEPQTKQLQHLTDWLDWYVSSLDGVLGEFPFEIEIADNDLIQTGDQTLRFSLPNIAETLAELTGKLLVQESESKAQINMLLRVLAESGSIKQQVIKNFYLSTATQEYLGYQVEQTTKDVEFLFNPNLVTLDENQQTLEKALEVTTLPIEIDTNVDEDTLEAQLFILTEAARINRARNWRSFSSAASIASQYVDFVKNADSLASDLGLDGQEDLEEFLEDVETGFAQESGSVNIARPFGRDFDRRPRTRKLR